MTEPLAPAPSSRRSRLWVGAGIAVALIVVVVVLSSRFGTDPSLVASPLIDQPAPDITLPYLEKPGQLTLSELEGDIVVVNFWASWCFPCRAEHPVLNQAAAAYADQDVTFLGVLFQDQASRGSEFLDEFGRGYEQVIDESSRAAIAFGLFGVPETFFIDRDGMLVGKVSGEITASLLTGTLDTMLRGEALGSTGSS